MPADNDPAMAWAYESHSEFEMAMTEWNATKDLFHYTSAQAAAVILTTGKLRLSPYPETNDLWETEPHHPALIGPQGEDPNATFAV